MNEILSELVCGTRYIGDIAYTSIDSQFHPSVATHSKPRSRILPAEDFACNLGFCDGQAVENWICTYSVKLE